MSEGSTGLLVLFSIAFISALGWHWLVSSYLRAAILATVTSVVAFQIAAYVHLGYLDPLFPIAVATSSAAALAIALLVGLPIRGRRKRREGKANSI